MISVSELTKRYGPFLAVDRVSFEIARGEVVGDDPEEAYVQQDLVAAARAALGTLGEADREALVATYWEEAASVGGATLRKRRARALERLRTAFRRLYVID